MPRSSSSSTVSLELRREGRSGCSSSPRSPPRRRARNPRERRRGRGRARRGGSAPVVLLLLPGLVGFAAAIGAARLLPVVGRLFARRGDASVRLAGVSLARHRARRVSRPRSSPSRSGLRRLPSRTARPSRRASATGRVRVPTDIVVRENLRALVPCSAQRPSSGTHAAGRRCGPSDRAGDRQRGAGICHLRGHRPRGVRGRGQEHAALEGGLGLEPLDARRDDRDRRTAGAPRSRAAGDGARARSRPGLLSYVASIEQRDGTFRTLELGAADAKRPSRPLRAPSRGGARRAARRARSLPPRLDDRGADSGVALRGRTTLRVLGVPLDDWVGRGRRRLSVAAADPGPLDLAYVLTNQRAARVRPRQVTDGTPPAAVVTTRLGELAGGIGGSLPLRIGGEQIAVEVAAVVERIPGTVGDAVLVDREPCGPRSTAMHPDARRSRSSGSTSSRRERARRGRALTQAVRRARDELRAEAEEDARATHSPTARSSPSAQRRSSHSCSRSRASCSGPRRPARRPRRARRPRGAGRDAALSGDVGRADPRRAAGVLGRLVGGLGLAVLVTRVVAVTARADRAELPLVTTVDPWCSSSPVPR